MQKQLTLTNWRPSEPLSNAEYIRVTKSDKTGRETIALMSVNSKDKPCIKSVSGKSGAELVNFVTDLKAERSQWFLNEINKAHAAGRVMFTRMGVSTNGRGSLSFAPAVGTNVNNATALQLAERAGQLGFKMVPIEGEQQSSGAPAEQLTIDAATGKVEEGKGKGKGKK